jgi:hypothetical protein
VGKEAVVQKGKQARVLRAQLFGEIYKDSLDFDLAESEPAIALIELIGRTEADAIFEEVMEALSVTLRQKLLKRTQDCQALRSLAAPNKGNRAPQPRKRYA